MANNPKKVKDPTEVALSAIQEALNISDAPIDSSRDSIRSDVTPANSPSSQDYNPSAFDTRPSADRQTFESAVIQQSRMRTLLQSIRKNYQRWKAAISPPLPAIRRGQWLMDFHDIIASPSLRVIADECGNFQGHGESSQLNGAGHVKIFPE